MSAVMMLIDMSIKLMISFAAETDEMGDDSRTVSMHDSLIAVARHIVGESNGSYGMYITNSRVNVAPFQVWSSGCNAELQSVQAGRTRTL